jgi:hypothetical protein
MKSKTSSKLVSLTVLVGTGMLVASSPTAFAALDTFGWTYANNDPSSPVTYDFTFASGGMNATGTITVENGVAQAGSINVTGVPLEASPSTLNSASGSLLPANGVTTAIDHDGDDIIYDNLVLMNDPILDGDGLGFGSGQYQDSSHCNTVINLWGNSPGSYSLFVGEANLDANGNVIGDAQWIYAQNDGSLTLIAVPEPTPYGALAGASLLLVSVGQQLRRKQG